MRFCSVLELPSDFGALPSLRVCSPYDACPRFPPLPFIHSLLPRQEKLFKRVSSVYSEDGIRCSGPGTEEGRETAPRVHLGFPQDSQVRVPDPTPRFRSKRSLRRTYPVDHLGIRLSRILVWYLIGMPCRVASPRRVRSRIRRFCSSLRDGLTGKKWRLFGGGSKIFVRYTITRPITFHQHRAYAGSCEQVEVCVVGIQCPSIRQIRFPNALLPGRPTCPAVSDPPPASRCCRCTHDAIGRCVRSERI